MGEFEESSKDKVVKQVEFYFSESNLYYDEFLRKRIGRNEEGWVDLKTICAFRRMQTLLQLNVAKPDNIPEPHLKKVAEALQDSKLVEINESITQIRRREPLPSQEELEEKISQRSLFVEPFAFDVTVEDLTHFFLQHGTVLLIVLRKSNKLKKFKGNAFVEFSSPEDAAKVKDMELEFQGAKLRMQPKKDWWENKKKAKEQQEEGYFDSDAEVPSDANRNYNSNRNKDQDNNSNKNKDWDRNRNKVQDSVGEQDKLELPDIEVEKGCFLRFSFEEISDTEQATTKIENIPWDMIKNSFGGKEKVAYVSWQNEDSESKDGFIRFRNVEVLKQMLKENEIEGTAGKMKVCGFLANVRVLEGEEEEQILQQTIEKIQQAQRSKQEYLRNNPRPGKKRRGGFLGRGRNKRGR